jgi:pimeloyl-ACP methyl ester carboxylesterase
MPKVKVDEGEITYEEQGKGDEAFIFVSPASNKDVNRDTDEMQSLFPPNYHFYLVDLPLYEKSIHKKEFDVIKHWGDDIYTFSRKLGLKKFIYMGISRWGLVGYSLVLNHPEAVKGFVALVSVPIPTQQRIDPGVFEALASGDNKARVEASVRDMFYTTTDKERLARQKRWIKSHTETNEPFDFKWEKSLIDHATEVRMETFKHLGEIKVPTLLIFGDKDPTNPLDQAVKAAMTIPEAKAVFFQGYAHLLMVESPEKVADEIVLFVNDLNRNK